MMLHSFIVFAILCSGIYACGQHALVPSSSEEDVISQVLARSPSSATSKTAIRNVRVFNGYHFTLPTTIIFDGEYITDDVDTIETTIDGTGQFLIPGLFDSHLHISDLSGLENATSYGVTTVINMACRNYAACWPLRNQAGLASFYSAGIPATGVNSSHANSMKLPPSMLTYPNTDITELVSQAFGNSSDFYKITAEIMGPSQQQQIEAVAVAHNMFHRQTMTHASDVNAYSQAVASQTDGIQHVPDDGPLSACTIASMKARGQFSTPTMNIFKLGYSDPAIAAFTGRTNSTDRSYSNVVKNVQRLHRAGIPIVAGTDAVGSNAVPGVDIPFGRTLHDELYYLVNEGGLTTAEALRAATSEPAKRHRLEDRGTVQVGKRADLILLNSNPLANISNTLDIARIWAGGIVVEKIATLA
ncbi:hypothetical protein F5Y04DRAFT_267359 [Hypomontagnella monticulosa]|nr:hypothetical protein F5Y04DRAFT_267359 [Hypomontagnella monticulosa]